MEKVLVSEVLYAQGHKRLNEKYVKCIAKNFEVYLLDDGDYFTSLKNEDNIRIINFAPLHVKRVEMLKTLSNAWNLSRIASIAKKHGISNVVLLSFHTLGFNLVKKHFADLNVCVVHHYEIDRMVQNPMEILKFNKYKDIRGYI